MYRHLPLRNHLVPMADQIQECRDPQEKGADLTPAPHEVLSIRVPATRSAARGHVAT